MALTILCTLLAFRVKLLPAYLAAGAFWSGLLTTFLLDPTMANFGDITFVGTVFYAAGIILWIFVPLLLSMRTSIQSEKRIRGIKGRGGMSGEEAEITTKTKWKFSKDPKPTAFERQRNYKAKLREGRR